jgi:hypothetical protein
MLFKDTTAVYSKNHMKYINTRLPLGPKNVVEFPNNELCLLNLESVDKHG